MAVTPAPRSDVIMNMQCRWSCRATGCQMESLIIIIIVCYWFLFCVLLQSFGCALVYEFISCVVAACFTIFSRVRIEFDGKEAVKMRRQPTTEAAAAREKKNNRIYFNLEQRRTKWAPEIGMGQREKNAIILYWQRSRGGSRLAVANNFQKKTKMKGKENNGEREGWDGWVRHVWRTCYWRLAISSAAPANAIYSIAMTLTYIDNHLQPTPCLAVMADAAYACASQRNKFLISFD